MAALTCEICGGKLIGKPGGVFECDSCGMEYNTEWAKAKIQEIKGTVQVEGTVEVQGTVKVEGAASAESLLKRGMMALEDAKWDAAKSCFDQVLNSDPEYAEAYLGLAMASAGCRTRDELAAHYVKEVERFGEYWPDKNFKRAKQFAQGELQAWIEQAESMARAKEQEKEEERQREEEQERLEQQREEEKRKAKAVELAPLQRRVAPAAHLVASNYDVGIILGVRTDGKIVAAGRNVKKVPDDLFRWTDIVAISVGSAHVVGLKANGTVVVVGENKYGQCNVSGWRDIVAISASDRHTVGLKSDGTVVAVGDNEDGQCNVSEWRDIIAISAQGYYTVGLKSDGTVVAVGYNKWGQCDVSWWTDITAIAAGGSHTVGLKSDGTMVATGSNGNGKCNVSPLSDIVAVAATLGRTMGVKSNGTVVIVGEDGTPYDTSKWRDIVAFFSGWYEVGVKSDGTVVAGNTIDGEVTEGIREWKLFDNVETIERERTEIVAMKKAALEVERANLQTELANLKGLFSGGHRREIEIRLAEIEAKLQSLQQ